MAIATITSKGQITIPQSIRQRLGLKTGDRIDFVLDPSGRFFLRSQRKPFEQLRGIVKTTRRKPVSVEEMDAAIADTAAARFLRAVGRSGSTPVRKRRKSR